MFDNLVESKVHKDDLARKGSFLLGTVAIYTLIILVVLGVWVTYQVNNIEPLDYELLAELDTPVTPVQAEPEPEEIQKPQPTTTEQEVATRTELVASADTPTSVPKEVSAVASKVPSVPPGGAVLGTRNTNPSAATGPVGTGGAGSGSGPVVPSGPPAAVPPPPPPPKPTPTPVPKNTIVSGGVLNGKAISKPAPPYPPNAKAVRASGTVVVQILVSETGSVISATAVSGHPLLRGPAAAAAKQARFSPTLLSGQPVKVNGTITYNFKLE